MIPVSTLACWLDDFHTDQLGCKPIDPQQAAELGVALARMDAEDLLVPGQWIPNRGFFAALTDRTTLVFTNIRGLYVGLDPDGHIYKIEKPLDTRWSTTYSAPGCGGEIELPRRETLEQAQLRAEAHRRLIRHQASTAATTSGS